MVSFNENPESYGDNRMLNQLDAQIKRTIELAHKLRTVDRDIASSPLYIQKVPSPLPLCVVTSKHTSPVHCLSRSRLSNNQSIRLPAVIGVGGGTTSTWVISTWAVLAA